MRCRNGVRPRRRRGRKLCSFPPRLKPRSPRSMPPPHCVPAASAEETGRTRASAPATRCLSYPFSTPPQERARGRRRVASAACGRVSNTIRRGFIRADTIALTISSAARRPGARDAGKLRRRPGLCRPRRRVLLFRFTFSHVPSLRRPASASARSPAPHVRRMPTPTTSLSHFTRASAVRRPPACSSSMPTAAPRHAPRAISATRGTESASGA